MEHRCGYRRIISVDAILRTWHGVVGKGVLCEVSASGVRVTTSLPLAIHSVVSLQFDVARSVGRPKRETLPAEVVRSTPTGFAMEWLEFGPKAVRGLYAPISAESAPPVQRRAQRRRVRRSV